jgi:hypothetical protein
LILVVVPASKAEWLIYKRAQYRNSDNIHLHFDSLENQWIRIRLIFPEGVEGATPERPPLYQIDANEVHDLKENIEIRFDKNKHRWLDWIIHKGEKPYSEELQEFLLGKKVIFQYYLPDGMIKETTFKLDGLKGTIEEIYD